MTVPAVINKGFDEASHTYAINGNVVPSVTQVLNAVGFIDYSHVPADVLSAAQVRGTHVHKAIHYYLEYGYGEGGLDLNTLDEAYHGYFNSALLYLESARLKPIRHPETNLSIGVEWRFWDVDYMTAGTVDYLAWDPDGALSVNDWKTGHPEDVAAALQTGAYAFFARKHLFPTMKREVRRRAIKLYADGRPGKPVPYDHWRDLQQFIAALSCVHFKRNGLKHPVTYGRTA